MLRHSPGGLVQQPARFKGVGYLSATHLAVAAAGNNKHSTNTDPSVLHSPNKDDRVLLNLFYIAWIVSALKLFRYAISKWKCCFYMCSLRTFMPKQESNGETAMHDSKSIVHSYTEFLGAMF